MLEDVLDKIICGDSLYLMKEIPSESINLIITSPPYYKQRDYGMGIGNENRFDDYIENLCNIFHECVRVLRNDGSIIFNIGDKYENSSLLLAPYRFALEAIRRESVKLVNNITWVKLNPTPRQFKRRLVSSTEPFFHFVKSDDYYYDIDAFMDYPNKKRIDRNNGNIGKKYFDLIEQSFLSDEEKSMAKKELLDVIQEVKSGKLDSFRMKIRGIHSQPFGGQEGGRKIQLEKKGFTIIRIHGNSLKRDVIECPVETIKGGKHPAVYPEYIVTQFMKLLTKEDDIVLDPFIGSGTTAIVCKKLKRHYIGFEINPEYCEYAEKRLNDIQSQFVMEFY
ncbi:TPA: site-specific DNA-methyltransferase [Candidatus Poribacteria bacterium]|nr:site-specific DNA-methyltransferase [Candidatus Poribacteria bacterium]